MAIDEIKEDDKKKHKKLGKAPDIAFKVRTTFYSIFTIILMLIPINVGCLSKEIYDQGQRVQSR